MKHLFRALVRETDDSCGSKRRNRYTCGQCVTSWKQERCLETNSLSLDRALDVNHRERGDWRLDLAEAAQAGAPSSQHVAHVPDELEFSERGGGGKPCRPELLACS